VNVRSCAIVAERDLGGQPVSIDGRYAAVAIENERDEDVNDGAIPQLPAGFLPVVDLTGLPASCPVRRVELTGLADVAPEDPEPNSCRSTAATWWSSRRRKTTTSRSL
jgi:hypothetical protein